MGRVVTEAARQGAGEKTGHSQTEGHGRGATAQEYVASPTGVPVFSGTGCWLCRPRGKAWTSGGSVRLPQADPIKPRLARPGGLKDTDPLAHLVEPVDRNGRHGGASTAWSIGSGLCAQAIPWISSRNPIDGIGPGPRCLSRPMTVHNALRPVPAPLRDAMPPLECGVLNAIACGTAVGSPRSTGHMPVGRGQRHRSGSSLLPIPPPSNNGPQVAYGPKGTCPEAHRSRACWP